MRDTAGSAAAPAARCRNCRRESFIFEPPSHHSITSSAIASSPGGTASPNAFAVFMLITSTNLVGCITGRSGWLVAFENAADIDASLAIRIPVVGAIAHQATGGGEIASDEDCRD